MDDPRSSPRPALAGGVFIALLMPIGAVAGGLMGQPTIGMIIGTLSGAAIAGVVWLVDRRRR